jgi:tripartite-type tricarboxylate transporter receptor subunit TctC
MEDWLGMKVRIENVAGAGGLIGSRALRDSRPDGTTLGILNGPGLLVAAVCGVPGSLDPVNDFGVVCRLARSWQIWATGGNSRLYDFGDVVRVARTRPLVFALNNIGGVSFVNVAVTSHLLGLDVAYVPGFRGSRETSMAAVRGDVDIVALNFESIADRVETDDLRPLLQITDRADPSEPLLAGVPVLAGPEGVLGRYPEVTNGERARLLEQASGLIELIGAGRIVAMSPNTAPEQLECIERLMLDLLKDPRVLSLARRSQRTLDVCSGDQARSEIASARHKVAEFIPVIQGAIRAVRG